MPPTYRNYVNFAGIGPPITGYNGATMPGQVTRDRILACLPCG